MTFALRVNLTCGSNGCTRHSATNIQDSFQNFRSKEDALRTAMRDSRKVTLPLEGATVKIFYFMGKKQDPFGVCRDSQVSSIRGKVTLCSKYNTTKISKYALICC